MRRLLIATLIVWACSCGVKGSLPVWAQLWVANQAQAANSNPNQAFADALCVALDVAYGTPTKGYRITFKHCRYSDRNQSGISYFWVWFKVVHRHRVTLNVAKVDASGQLAEGPYKLSPYEYDHNRLPGPPA